MPIALIAAGVGAVASVAGAAISSGAQKSAARTAATAADNNNAIQQQVRQENTTNLSPYMTRGNAAGANYNALLGLSGPGPQVGNFYSENGGVRPGSGVSVNVTPSSAMNAFNTYKGSDGYQFRVGEGLNALNTGYAARGAINSGAAMKAIDTYGQGQASDEFGKYLGYLNNQQQIGLSGANALAGVNTNFANQVSSNNNNAAGAAGNAAIGTANAINGGINGTLKALSTYQGQQSSYGGGNGGNGGWNENTGGNATVNTDKYNPFLTGSN